MLKLSPNTIIDLEKLQGYLKMTYEFSGQKRIKWKILRDIIVFHVKEEEILDDMNEHH